jgi:hypothetical protein
MRINKSCAGLVAALSILSTAAFAQSESLPWHGPRWDYCPPQGPVEVPTNDFIPREHSYINSLGEWIPSLDDPWHLPGSQ